MEIINLSLPGTNKFASEYYFGGDQIKPYFHYDYQSNSDYEERLNELSNRTFLRKELTDHISSFMSKYPSSDEVLRSLEKLKDEKSVVVIGGQQAGILTGPLYSIHKVISIIAFAKKKEKELNVPVVPIFWIAGEDHDYAEVNHVYIEDKERLEKWVYPERVLDKRMVTDCAVDRSLCVSWIQAIVESFGETEHTKELIRFVEKAIDCSHNFIDFFAYIIMELFKEQGLLLVDSGNRELRKLEQEYFIEQIKNAEKVTDAVLTQQEELAHNGFSKAIDIPPNGANLFYYDEEHFERILLEYDKEANLFLGKDGSLSFSFEDLLTIASEQPEKLSNNVVTRPIMQEKLFPTLAFIAGPGEISYWAELKRAFEVFSLKMPPIIPRLNITLLERDIDSAIKELNLDLLTVMQDGVTREKEAFLESVKDKGFEELFARTKKELLTNYESISEKMGEEYRGLLPLLKKNEGIHLKQLAYMEGKIEEALHIKYETRIRKYNRIESSLRPLGGPQERVWNIFYFLNKYGLHLVEELSRMPMEFDGRHKVVKL